MEQKNLQSLLNEHLGGAVAGLQLAERLQNAFADDPENKAIFEWLVAQIKEDRQTLDELVERVGEHSLLHRGAGWLSEKLGQTRPSKASENLDRLMQIQMLYMGITGKKLLWRALAEAPDESGLVEDFDWGRLEARAREQLDRLDECHNRVATRAFSELYST